MYYENGYHLNAFNVIPIFLMQTLTDLPISQYKLNVRKMYCIQKVFLQIHWKFLFLLSNLKANHTNTEMQ